MHERKEGTLKSGKSGKKVTSKKPAIAIGLSEARKEGGKVPRKKSSRKNLHQRISLRRRRSSVSLHEHAGSQALTEPRSKGAQQ
jgi:hypothetical protein